MFCPNCRCQICDEVVFCPACGAQIRIADNARGTQSPQTPIVGSKTVGQGYDNTFKSSQSDNVKGNRNVVSQTNDLPGQNHYHASSQPINVQTSEDKKKNGCLFLLIVIAIPAFILYSWSTIDYDKEYGWLYGAIHGLFMPFNMFLGLFTERAWHAWWVTPLYKPFFWIGAIVAWGYIAFSAISFIIGLFVSDKNKTN